MFFVGEGSLRAGPIRNYIYQKAYIRKCLTNRHSSIARFQIPPIRGGVYDGIVDDFENEVKMEALLPEIKSILFNPYQHFEVSYETFVKSLIENQKRNITFNLWKYNPNADYSLDLPQIISDLNDYITSQNSKPQYRGPRSFGLQACANF